MADERKGSIDGRLPVRQLIMPERIGGTAIRPVNAPFQFQMIRAFVDFALPRQSTVRGASRDASDLGMESKGTVGTPGVPRHFPGRWNPVRSSNIRVWKFNRPILSAKRLAPQATFFKREAHPGHLAG
ncbi:MAG: hypothetical protein LBI87_09805 [Candidatus Accumulibacter sp.]|nr:hypothetical protein [Accumulibacter sp.]